MPSHEPSRTPPLLMQTYAPPDVRPAYHIRMQHCLHHGAQQSRLQLLVMLTGRRCKRCWRVAGWPYSVPGSSASSHRLPAQRISRAVRAIEEHERTRHWSAGSLPGRPRVYATRGEGIQHIAALSLKTKVRSKPPLSMFRVVTACYAPRHCAASSQAGPAQRRTG
jgi:hypothetical protein